MKITVNIKTAINDFEWVIRVLESSETEYHMDCANKCFLLWEKKHIDKSVTDSDIKMLNRLRSNFWSLFKNKNSRFVATTNI
jgi:hypothetical protein